MAEEDDKNEDDKEDNSKDDMDHNIIKIGTTHLE